MRSQVQMVNLSIDHSTALLLLKRDHTNMEILLLLRLCCYRMAGCTTLLYSRLYTHLTVIHRNQSQPTETRVSDRGTSHGWPAYKGVNSSTTIRAEVPNDHV